MTKRVILEIIDPVYCKIVEGDKLLKPALSYTTDYYIQGPYSKRRVDHRRSLMWKSKKEGAHLFFRGFLQRVTQYCENQDIPLSVEDHSGDHFTVEREPDIPGINIRDGNRSYQYDLIKAAVSAQRGVILSATASGKTIMMLGVLSCSPQSSFLFLSNGHVPITQFKKALHKYGFQNYNIQVSTIQSLHRRPPEEYIDSFDAIIIDECHEFGGTDGMYAKVLKNSLAPLRVGFTATMPSAVEVKFALEGLVGPVLGELSIQEGTELGVLARPQLNLIELPENKMVKDLKMWRDVYREGVVNNRARNLAVVQEVKRHLEGGRSVLVLIIEIEHGENIVDMAQRLYGLDIVFVQGKTDSEVREQIRLAMIDKKVKAVVASAVFRKALDVPTLDVVINACGGKSETITLQAIGRGLRITEEKEEVEVVDFFDPSHQYLVKHFGHRICMYFREGWL